MQTAVLAIGFCLSVCLSFRHSPVCVQTNKDTIVRFTAPGRTIPLVSGEVKFIRIFAGSVKVKHSLSIAKILPTIGHNLETVQDMRQVTINH